MGLTIKRWLYFFILGLGIGFNHCAGAAEPELTKKSIEGVNLFFDNFEKNGMEKVSIMAKEMYQSLEINPGAHDFYKWFAFEMSASTID